MLDTFWEITLFAMLWPIIIAGIAYVRIISILNRMITDSNDNISILIKAIPGIERKKDD